MGPRINYILKSEKILPCKKSQHYGNDFENITRSEMEITKARVNE